ncbi:DUF5131 family protein [Methylobacter sp.]|uniref:DUF5131 family protein n=1 Tax=Methylobacter sp. TaxID=2051955 RepID=UPI002FDCE791
MSAKTNIEWADATWNPVTGCSKMSQGCKYCYAERDWPRMAKVPAYVGRKFTDVRWHYDRLEIPLRWQKPRLIFVNSMSDLFHESVPFDFIHRVMVSMQQAPRHIYQVLTKRPARVLEFFDYWGDEAKEGFAELMPNVWLGVSVEDQKTASERIPLLLSAPAAVHWISAEPLLGKVDIRSGHIPNGLDWVVVGGESGPNARPMHPDWVRSLRDQCIAAEVPFLFKQWGEWAPVHELRCNEPGVKGKIWHNFDPDTSVCRVGKKQSGRLIDGVEYNGYPGVKHE